MASASPSHAEMAELGAEANAERLLALVGGVDVSYSVRTDGTTSVTIDDQLRTAGSYCKRLALRADYFIVSSENIPTKSLPAIFAGVEPVQTEASGKADKIISIILTKVADTLKSHQHRKAMFVCVRQIHFDLTSTPPKFDATVAVWVEN